jgi:hypothetical protein
MTPSGILPRLGSNDGDCGGGAGLYGVIQGAPVFGFMSPGA